MAQRSYSQKPTSKKESHDPIRPSAKPPHKTQQSHSKKEEANNSSPSFTHIPSIRSTAPSQSPFNTAHSPQPFSAHSTYIQKKALIQREPDPKPEPSQLTNQQITDALIYNGNRFFDPVEIGSLRTHFGLSATPALIDIDFVRAVGRYQHKSRETENGKLDERTARALVLSLMLDKKRQTAATIGIRYQSNETLSNVTINNQSGLFDAELDHKNAQLILRMRVNFDFIKGSKGMWPNEEMKAVWIDQFITSVQAAWSNQFLLKRSSESDSNYLKYYTPRVEVVSSEVDPHFTAKIKYGRFIRHFTAVLAGQHEARFDRTALKTTKRWRITNTIHQKGVDHEFGHMLGLDHIAGAKNRQRDYGRSREQRENIMGLGSKVTVENDDPFTQTMAQISGLEWDVVPSYTLIDS